jgi:hypothetical protein
MFSRFSRWILAGAALVLAMAGNSGVTEVKRTGTVSLTENSCAVMCPLGVCCR